MDSQTVHDESTIGDDTTLVDDDTGQASATNVTQAASIPLTTRNLDQLNHSVEIITATIRQERQWGRSTSQAESMLADVVGVLVDGFKSASRAPRHPDLRGEMFEIMQKACVTSTIPSKPISEARALRAFAPLPLNWVEHVIGYDEYRMAWHRIIQHLNHNQSREDILTQPFRVSKRLFTRMISETTFRDPQHRFHLMDFAHAAPDQIRPGEKVCLQVVLRGAGWGPHGSDWALCAGCFCEERHLLGTRGRCPCLSLGENCVWVDFRVC